MNDHGIPIVLHYQALKLFMLSLKCQLRIAVHDYYKHLGQFEMNLGTQLNLRKAIGLYVGWTVLLISSVQ